jgi:hypothetical protein
MLQAGRPRDRISMRSLDFFNVPNPSSRTMTLGLTQPLTEMSTRNSLGGRHIGLTTLLPSMSGLSRKCGNVNISQPYWPPWPVTGIPLLYLYPSTNIFRIRKTFLVHNNTVISTHILRSTYRPVSLLERKLSGKGTCAYLGYILPSTLTSCLIGLKCSPICCILRHSQTTNQH